MQEITSTVGEGIYVLDPNGLVTFVNPEVEKMLGWTAAERVGQQGHQLFHYKHPDGSPFTLAECQVHKSLASSETYRSPDDWLVWKDGSTIPVSLVSSPIIQHGEIKGSVAAFQDITELNQPCFHKKIISMK